MSLLNSTPLVSRVLAASVLVFSIGIYTGYLDYLYYMLPFDLTELVSGWHRLFTSFLITGPYLGILIDSFLLFHYGAELEVSSPRFSQRVDFVFYVFCIWMFILILNIFFISGTALASPLALAFTTTSVRDNRNKPIIFINLNLPCQYLPYVLLFLSLILVSPQTMFVRGTGIAAADIYDLLSGNFPATGLRRNLVETPWWLTAAFGRKATPDEPHGLSKESSAKKKNKDWSWRLDYFWGRFGSGRKLGSVDSISEGRFEVLGVTVLIWAVLLAALAISGYFFLLHGFKVLRFTEDTADKIMKLSIDAPTVKLRPTPKIKY